MVSYISNEPLKYAGGLPDFTNEHDGKMICSKKISGVHVGRKEE